MLALIIAGSLAIGAGAGFLLCALLAVSSPSERELELLDEIETARGIIANVSDGDWFQQSREWREAARRWDARAITRTKGK